jgi:hypothetical protein
VINHRTQVQVGSAGDQHRVLAGRARQDDRLGRHGDLPPGLLVGVHTLIGRTSLQVRWPALTLPVT